MDPRSVPLEVTAERVARFHRAAWLPFWFTTFLCALSVGATMFGAGGAVGPVFVCFLPMAFWFTCATQRGLSERLWALEQQRVGGTGGE